MKRKNTMAKLLLRIEVLPPTILDTGCWHYAGKAARKGYPVACLDGRQRKVYQIIHEHFTGPLPPGHERHHRCQNKLCCNHEHIDVVTPQAHAALHPNQKALGAYAMNALRRAKPTCKRGHVYAGDNLGWRVERSGKRSRVCLACLKITRLARERKEV